MSDGAEVRRERIPFALVPESLIFDDVLSAGAKVLWVALDRYANAEREAWPSSRTLARRLKVTRPTISRWLDELVDRGWVSRVDRTRPDGSRTSPLLTLSNAPDGGGTSACHPGTPTFQGGTSACPGLNESHLTRVSEEPPSRAVARTSDSHDSTQVLSHWAHVARRAQVIKHGDPLMTPGRREKITRRLKEGYTVDQLCTAIDGAFGSSWHRSKPAWLELSSILGSREKVDRHILNAAGNAAASGDIERRVNGTARVLALIDD